MAHDQCRDAALIDVGAFMNGPSRSGPFVLFRAATLYLGPTGTHWGVAKW